MTKAVLDTDGPLYKWWGGLAKDALKQPRDAGAQAKIVTDCPYSIKMFHPCVVATTWADVAPHPKMRSLALIGRAGSGKSTLMEALLVMFSRYWQGVLGLDGPASYRTAPVDCW